MAINPAMQARVARNAGNAADAINAPRPGMLERASGALNYLVMGPMLLGALASRPLTFLGNKFNIKSFQKAGGFFEFDRAMNTKSIGQIVDEAGAGLNKAMPSVVSGFTNSAGNVSSFVSESKAGKAVASGEVSGFFDRAAKVTRGDKLFKWYQKQNLAGANGFHEGLGGQLQALNDMASKAGHSHITSEINSISAHLGSVDSIHKAGPELMERMGKLTNDVKKLRVGATGEAAKELNVLHREISSVGHSIGNVLNKAEKANYTGVGEYLSKLPSRWGRSMSASTAAFGAVNVLYTASNVKDTVKDGRDSLKELHTVYTQMTGKTISDKALLTSKDVPDEIKVMRKSMRGTMANLGLNLASFAGSQVMFMRSGASIRTGMIGMALQMGGKAVADLVAPKSQSIGYFKAIEDAQAAGTNVPAQSYIDLLASVDKSSARSGQYGQTQMRADYLAIYAEEHQLKGGELLGLASKAGRDPQVKQQVTKEVDGLLAERKQAAAQAKFDAATPINPNARTDNVQRLNQGRSIQIGQAPAGQARA